MTKKQTNLVVKIDDGNEIWSDPYNYILRTRQNKIVNQTYFPTLTLALKSYVDQQAKKADTSGVDEWIERVQHATEKSIEAISSVVKGEEK